MKWFVISLILVMLGGGYVWLAPEASAPMGAVQPIESVNEVVSEIKRGGWSVEVYDGISVNASARELNLSGRNLAGSLKAEIRQLSQLETLDISNNSFTGLPAELGQLSNLRILNVSNNPLTGLPYELGNLQRLEVLDLRGTDYAAADAEIIKSQLPDSCQILVD